MTCFFLVLPKVSGRDNEQYVIAGWLLLLGLILWALTWFLNAAAADEDEKPAKPAAKPRARKAG